MKTHINPSLANSVTIIQLKNDSIKKSDEDSENNSNELTEVVAKKSSCSKTVRWSTPLTEVKVFHPDPIMPAIFSRNYNYATFKASFPTMISQQHQNVELSENRFEINMLAPKTFLKRVFSFATSFLHKNCPVINSRTIFGVLMSAIIMCFCYLLWSTSGSDMWF